MLRMRGGVVGGNRVLCVCASERVSMYELESTIYIYIYIVVGYVNVMCAWIMIT